MAESEKDDNIDVLNFYGTAVEQLDEDETIGKKPVPIQEQIATDEKGRRRFHGAFTGGFSAGYFNTVGSIEGWTPRTFQSSRQNRAEGNSQRPEDYMDTEDFTDHGIAPKKVTTRDAFAAQSGANEKRKYGVSGFDDPYKNMLAPLSESFGVTLLRKMGWKPGQGIGPRLRKTDKYLRRVQQGLIPSGTFTDAQDADSRAGGKLFSPDDVVVPKIDAKSNFHGLGYKGIDLSGKSGTREHFSLFEQPDTTVLVTAPTASAKTKKKGMTGQAFGVGAFEDDDDDIYSTDDFSRYDRVIGGEAVEKKNRNMKSIESGYGERVLEGFQRGSMPLHDRKIYPPPVIPKGFKGIHMVDSAAVETKTSDERPTQTMHRHDAKSRSEVLENAGRQPPVVTSVFDLIPAAQRNRLPAFQQSGAEKAVPPSSQPEKIPEPEPPTATVDEQRRQNLALFGCSATFESKMTFRPFEKDPAKQQRYDLFLRKRQERNKDAIEEVWMDVGASMTEWERERERMEFHRAAVLYRPMAGVMASRFTRAQAKEESSTEVEVSTNSSDVSQERKEAVKKKLYGRLTRDTLEWHPHNVMCKRFNVPNPYPGSNITGLLKVKKDKLSLFNFLNAPDGMSLPKERNSSEPTKDSGEQVAAEKIPPATAVSRSVTVGNAPKAKLTLPVVPLAPAQEPEASQAAEETGERPPMDLFRAIFASSDVEDAAEEADDLPVNPSQNEPFQKLFEIDRMAKTLQKKEFPVVKPAESLVGPVKPPPEVLAAYVAVQKISSAKDQRSEDETRDHKSKQKKKKKKQRKKHKKSRSRTHRDSESSNSDDGMPKKPQNYAENVTSSPPDDQSRSVDTHSPDMNEADLLKRLKNVLPGRRLTASDFM
ncbi:G patch domain-containing protein 1-like [Paramacrobiotus metropolitanus]|uniref:G patch domain-containing protein 1-like n=1 Tax=Paramacrobiotus metropolitanus TaxID=2943436 RepID=UPI0024463C4E|nr:G patch domain-containing protein 1-like [Paramacrobiotus metropolitanus]